MLDPFDSDNRPFFRALSRKRRRAFWSLAIERLIHHIWRPFFWTLFFCGLWMIGVPSFFGSGVSIITSIIFIIGLIYLIRRDVLTFHLPTNKKLDHRIEEKSDLPRGHIALLEDKLANPKKHETRDLWHDAHQKILKSLANLKAPNLRATLAKTDPYALRFLAVLVFISGLMLSGHQWKDRIFNGLTPFSVSSVLSQGRSTHLWVKPPEYTQMPSIHIEGTNSGDEALNIPEGSEIKIRLHSMLGTYFAPTLSINGASVNMTHHGEGLYGYEGKIENGERITITQTLIPRANWKYTLIPDTPPEIYSDAPKDKPLHEVIENSQIRIPLIVKDNYSVKDLSMRMDIDDMLIERPLGKAAEDIRLVMSAPNAEFKISPIYDMTWHTWAGLPVTFEYKAIDHSGQSATLDKIQLTLPERVFEHPMAKSLIAARKRLAWDYKDSFVDISEDLNNLLNAPDYFQHNRTIFLAIRTAAARLYFADKKPEQYRIAAATEVIKLLWDAAITIEDGNLSLAMRDLRDARSALENAMRDPNTSKDEIARLMDNLREKMQNYFAELQRDMQKRMENGEQFPELSGEMISPDVLAQLMEEIEQALRDGDEKKAQELMAKLQRMMEMVDQSMMAQMPKDMQMMKEGVNELQELIDKQKELLIQTEAYTPQNPSEQTFQGQNNDMLEKMMKDFGIELKNIPPRPFAQDTPKDKKEDFDFKAKKIEQDGLRYILGQLMLDVSEHVDDIPETMGLAEQEMRGSAENLEASDANGSIPHQEKAIEYLQDAQDNLSKQLSQRMQQMVGVGMNGGQRYDPLGRPYGGEDGKGNPNDNSKVKVPDEAEKKRVDDIIKQLRDRSSDRQRSREELEYFRRLLRQF